MRSEISNCLPAHSWRVSATPSRFKGFALPLCCALSLVVYLLSPAPRKDCLAISAIAFAVVLYPLILFLFTKQLIHVPVSVVSMLVWIYFCAPFTYSELPNFGPRRTLPEGYLLELALFPALSIGALILGYYLVPVSRRSLFNKEFRFSQAQLKRYSLLLVCVGAAVIVLQRLFPELFAVLGRVIGLLDKFLLFGALLALIGYLRGLRNRGFLLVGAVALFLLLLSILATTQFLWIAYSGACLLMIVLLERRKIPWVQAALVLALAFPVFVNRTVHRAQREREGYYVGDSLAAKIKMGIAFAVEDFTVWRWESMPDEMSRTLSTRLENVSFLGHCVSLHTHGKPFRHGDTMVGVFYSLIPRFVWPDKPKQNQGVVLSTEYGFKDPGPGASINWPWLADLYVNFGFWGMVLGSLALGALFRWCCSLAGYGQGDMNVLMFCDLCLWLFLAEANVAMVVGGILQSVVVWWLISRFMLPHLHLSNRYGSRAGEAQTTAGPQFMPANERRRRGEKSAQSIGR